MLTGFAWPRVGEAIHILETQPRGDDWLMRLVNDCEAPHVSEKGLVESACVHIHQPWASRARR